MSTMFVSCALLVAILGLGGQHAECAAEFGDGLSLDAEGDIDDAIAAPGLASDSYSVNDVTFEGGSDVVDRVVCGHGQVATGIAGAGEDGIGEHIQIAALCRTVPIAHFRADGEVAFTPAEVQRGNFRTNFRSGAVVIEHGAYVGELGAFGDAGGEDGVLGAHGKSSLGRVFRSAAEGAKRGVVAH